MWKVQMMNPMKFALFALLALVAPGAHASSETCDSACKESHIKAYFERLSTVYRRGSTSADVDRLFDLFAPDVRYVHKEFDAKFDRAGWKEAFNGNLQRGAYDKDAAELIEIAKIIHGRSHSAVEYRYMRRTADGKLVPADDQGGLLALFGFEGKKIVLVEEYW
jgi:hypothetical protein